MPRAALTTTTTPTPTTPLTTTTIPSTTPRAEDYEKTASRAGYYAASLALSLPARVGLAQLTQFLQAQRLTRPPLLAAAGAAVVNGVGALALVLGLPAALFHGDGVGWPAAGPFTAAVTWVQLLCCLALAPSTPCWPGWSLAHVTAGRVRAFAALYFPAALSGASDWWRAAAVGVMAARMGGGELAVFSSAQRVLWVALVFSGALGAATGIKARTPTTHGHRAFHPGAVSQPSPSPPPPPPRALRTPIRSTYCPFTYIYLALFNTHTHAH